MGGFFGCARLSVAVGSRLFGFGWNKSLAQHSTRAGRLLERYSRQRRANGAISLNSGPETEEERPHSSHDRGECDYLLFYSTRFHCNSLNVLFTEMWRGPSAEPVRTLPSESNNTSSTLRRDGSMKVPEAVLSFNVIQVYNSRDI